jgi:excisionase family DNA binding protein
MDEKKLLTAGEVAEKLRVSRQFIYNLSRPTIPRGQRLPSVKIGRLRRFFFDSVLQYF